MSVLFLGEIFDFEVSERHFFSDRCLCVCGVPAVSTAQKRFITETSNLEFYIRIIRTFYLFFYMKIGRHAKEFERTKSLTSAFNYV